MRTLNTGDAFKVLQIFRAAGMKNEFAELVDMAIAKKGSEKIGGRLFAILFDCLGHEKSEPLIIKLLSDISGQPPDELIQQPIADTVKLLKEIAKQSDIKSFFGDAASLT